MNASLNALTNQNYWDNVWNTTDIPPKSYPEINSVKNHGKNELHRFFSRHLKRVPLPASVLEFGCAQSTWLPYFARVHNMRVAGLDYSPLGCARANAILKRDNIEGSIYQRDIFVPPTIDMPQYDVGVSFGVVEHFEDPSIAISAMSVYLKPGGLMLTIVPNMAGITGMLQEGFNKPIFDLHQQLDAEALCEMHKKAGLETIEAIYILPIGLTVVNPGDNISYFSNAAFSICKLLTAAIWGIDKIINNSIPRTKMYSPYVACAALVGSR